ncbi:MAG: hypothetical protein ACNYWM_10160 [Methanosarcinales archaeon]
MRKNPVFTSNQMAKMIAMKITGMLSIHTIIRITDKLISKV